MKYIHVMLRVVKKVDDGHKKVLEAICQMPAKIRIASDSADSGTYKHWYDEKKADGGRERKSEILPVLKKDDRWYLVK